jgi:hypothetical protein
MQKNDVVGVGDTVGSIYGDRCLMEFRFVVLAIIVFVAMQYCAIRCAEKMKRAVDQHLDEVAKQEDHHA